MRNLTHSSDGFKKKDELTNYILFFTRPLEMILTLFSCLIYRLPESSLLFPFDASFFSYFFFTEGKKNHSSSSSTIENDKSFVKDLTMFAA